MHIILGKVVVDMHHFQSAAHLVNGLILLLQRDMCMACIPADAGSELICQTDQDIRIGSESADSGRYAGGRGPREDLAGPVETGAGGKRPDAGRFYGAASGPDFAGSLL